jgi:hypothetical protein
MGLAIPMVLMAWTPAAARTTDADARGHVTMLQDAGQIGGRSSPVEVETGKDRAVTQTQPADVHAAPPSPADNPARMAGANGRDPIDDCLYDRRLVPPPCIDPSVVAGLIAPLPDARLPRSIERYRKALPMWNGLRMGSYGHAPSRTGSRRR